MYSKLKNYKNLENRNIYGKIITLKRLQKRNVLIKFYPDDFETKVLIENRLKNNYFPIHQQLFILKDFLDENYFLNKVKNNFETKELLNKGSLLNADFIIKHPFKFLINNFLKLRLINSQFQLKDFF